MKTGKKKDVKEPTCIVCGKGASQDHSKCGSFGHRPEESKSKK